MSDSSPQARASIADFGFATKLQSPTDTLTWRVGTKGYTAPEILKGSPYSFGVDVWSLGCLMYTLLASSNPFLINEEPTLVLNFKVCHKPLNLDLNPATRGLSSPCKTLLS